MSYFISLDGMDGAGKSTQLALLKNWFEAQRRPVYFTREIGGTALGVNLREIILNPKNNLDPLAELLLVFSARRQHIEEVIRPKLRQGIIVVSDRFTDATYAYQGSGRQISWQLIAALEHWILADFRPQLALILNVSAATAAQRLSQRAGEKDRIELENSEFFERVRQGYLRRAAENPQARLIDANGSAGETFAQIELALNQLLGPL